MERYYLVELINGYNLMLEIEGFEAEGLTEEEAIIDCVEKIEDAPVAEWEEITEAQFFGIYLCRYYFCY